MNIKTAEFIALGEEQETNGPRADPKDPNIGKRPQSV